MTTNQKLKGFDARQRPAAGPGSRSLAPQERSVALSCLALHRYRRPGARGGQLRFRPTSCLAWSPICHCPKRPKERSWVYKDRNLGNPGFDPAWGHGRLVAKLSAKSWLDE